MKSAQIVTDPNSDNRQAIQIAITDQVPRLNCFEFVGDG
jgi:hypothetical protein